MSVITTLGRAASSTPVASVGNEMVPSRDSLSPNETGVHLDEDSRTILRVLDLQSVGMTSRGRVCASRRIAVRWSTGARRALR